MGGKVTDSDVGYGIRDTGYGIRRKASGGMAGKGRSEEIIRAREGVHQGGRNA
jgi:hypothetical protein